MQNKLSEALNYIEGHLDQSLTVQAISEQVGVSAFHFHRLFKLHFGLNLYDMIRGLRLKRAAYQLAYRQDKVIEIALNAQYQSPEAFSRAFFKVFKQTPSEFRKAADWSYWQTHHNPALLKRRLNSPVQNDYQVEFVHRQNIKIAYLSHQTNMRELGQTLQAFIQWRKGRALGPTKSRTFNLIYADAITGDDYRFDMACEFPYADLSEFDRESGIRVSHIPAGEFVKIRHIGSDDELANMAQFLYQYCMADKHLKLAHFPLFVERLRFFPDVPECESMSDIYLAIERTR